MITFKTTTHKKHLGNQAFLTWLEANLDIIDQIVFKDYTDNKIYVVTPTMCWEEDNPVRKSFSDCQEDEAEMNKPQGYLWIWYILQCLDSILEVSVKEDLVKKLIL